MEILPIKTRRLEPPKDDFFAALDGAEFFIEDGDMVVIASKVLSIHDGNTVPVGDIEKDDLIMQEAERYIPRKLVPGGYVLPTIKHHTLISSAGIDQSNGNGYYLLWPRDIQGLAKQLHGYLKSRFHVKQVGVVIADSHSVPLRHGAVGIGIGFYGFYPFIEYAGTEDLFQRKFVVERTNLVDVVAGAGVLGMGEGAQCTPLAVIRGVENAEFMEKDLYDEWVVDVEEDIYYPLLRAYKKKGEA